jgi:hypothetical protein
LGTVGKLWNIREFQEYLGTGTLGKLEDIGENLGN